MLGLIGVGPKCVEHIFWHPPHAVRNSCHSRNGLSGTGAYLEGAEPSGRSLKRLAGIIADAPRRCPANLVESRFLIQIARHNQIRTGQGAVTSRYVRGYDLEER